MAMRLEIDGWSAGLKFSACHFLPGHARCGRLHGHTYAVHIRLEGKKGEAGYIADFHDIKELFREIIEELDHRVLIPARHKRIKMEADRKKVRLDVMGKEYLFPREDVVLLDLPAVTAEELSGYILEKAAPSLRRMGKIDAVQVGLYEGVGQGAWASKEF
jgi:6-pyruvoyltetrahydropterin/6-carboxytetrahydropterin synthase